MCLKVPVDYQKNLALQPKKTILRIKSIKANYYRIINNTDNIDKNLNKIEILNVNNEEENHHKFYDFAKNEYSKFFNISALNPNSKKHLLHSFITFAYFLGSILYLSGSVLLWPSFNAGSIPIWIYRVGSCLYLSGSYTFYSD